MPSDLAQHFPQENQVWSLGLGTGYGNQVWEQGMGTGLWEQVMEQGMVTGVDNVTGATVLV